MYSTIRLKYYWVNLYTDVFMWCRTCEPCQTGKPGLKFRAPLKTLTPPNTVFQRWHTDHLALPSADGYNYVLLCIDSFSLWPVLLPARSTSAEETARLLFDHIFMVYGAKTILSDRGAAFRSQLMTSLCKLLGVKQVYTSSRHPQTNSRAESFSNNILNSLRTSCNSVSDWPRMLSAIGHSFRTSVAKPLGISPYEVVFGQAPMLALDHLLFEPPFLPANAKTYFDKMAPILKVLRETVRERQVQAQEKTK